MIDGTALLELEHSTGLKLLKVICAEPPPQNSTYPSRIRDENELGGLETRGGNQTTAMVVAMVTVVVVVTTTSTTTERPTSQAEHARSCGNRPRAH